MSYDTLSPENPYLSRLDELNEDIAKYQRAEQWATEDFLNTLELAELWEEEAYDDNA